MKRYTDDPIDNHGTLDGPPRDRTWGVLDRTTGEHVAEFDVRRLAREEADRLNEQYERTEEAKNLVEIVNLFARLRRIITGDPIGPITALNWSEAWNGRVALRTGEREFCEVFVGWYGFKRRWEVVVNWCAIGSVSMHEAAHYGGVLTHLGGLAPKIDAAIAEASVQMEGRHDGLDSAMAEARSRIGEDPDERARLAFDILVERAEGSDR